MAKYDLIIGSNGEVKVRLLGFLEQINMISMCEREIIEIGNYRLFKEEYFKNRKLFDNFIRKQKNLYSVRYLIAPIEKNLFYSEITDYAEQNFGFPIEDLGLSIVTVYVEAANQRQATRNAAMKMLRKSKGYTFEMISAGYAHIIGRM